MQAVSKVGAAAGPWRPCQCQSGQADTRSTPPARPAGGRGPPGGETRGLLARTLLCVTTMAAAARHPARAAAAPCSLLAQAPARGPAAGLHPWRAGSGPGLSASRSVPLRNCSPAAGHTPSPSYCPQFGTRRWAHVSSMLPGRSSKACSHRWVWGASVGPLAGVTAASPARVLTVPSAAAALRAALLRPPAPPACGDDRLRGCVLLVVLPRHQPGAVTLHPAARQRTYAPSLPPPQPAALPTLAPLCCPRTCRWSSFLNPEIKHPRLEPLSDWEIAVIMQAQLQYGNRWKRECTSVAACCRVSCARPAACCLVLHRPVRHPAAQCSRPSPPPPMLRQAPASAALACERTADLWPARRVVSAFRSHLQDAARQEQLCCEELLALQPEQAEPDCVGDQPVSRAPALALCGLLAPAGTECSLACIHRLLAPGTDSLPPDAPP